MSRRREIEDDFYDDEPPRRESRRDTSRRPARGRDERPRRKRRGFFGAIFYWCAVASVWCAIGLAGLIGYYALKLPPIDQLSVPKRPPNIAILAADGTLMANRGETGGRNIAIGELPPHVPKAFIAIEDKRFNDHFGLDLVGLGRAVYRNLTSGKLEQGGSTLTQQLAKNIFLTQERSFSRKAQEAILALWLERNYSKDQILELYLNRVYFGSGAYGIEAAAQRYYAKSARLLTLGEAATLAGLMKSPSRLAPNRNPAGAAERAGTVLKEMLDQGMVSDAQYKTALASPPEVRRNARAGSVNYAADWVMDLIDDYVGAIDTDVQVTTTFLMPMQNAAEKALSAIIETSGDAKNVDQGAIVAMAPDGAVRALVGGRNYAESQFNRAVLARRQPGSAFKPFVYLTALEHGLTPETVREDSPVNIKGWQPANYTREHFGAVSLTRALAMSLNTVAVKLGQEAGIKNVIRTAQRLGINSPLANNASLALGTSEVSPLELTAAYTAFSNGGIAVTPYVIRRVKTVDGKLIYERKDSVRARVIEPQTLAQLNMMMRETLVSGTAKKAELPGWVAAGKTGTTQDHKDAWFVGYTGALTATVWLGNDDGDPMKKVTGSGLPVDVWSRFMKAALAGQPGQPLPGLAGVQPATAEPDKPRVGYDHPAYRPDEGRSGEVVRPPLNLSDSQPMPPVPRARPQNAPPAEIPVRRHRTESEATPPPQRQAPRQDITREQRMVPPKAIGTTGSIRRPEPAKAPPVTVQPVKVQPVKARPARPAPQAPSAVDRAKLDNLFSQ